MTSINQNSILKFFLFLTTLMILIPIILILIWVFVGQWKWPSLLPQTFSLRAIKEVLSLHSKLFEILCSNIILSLSVAILSTIVGIMTARALVFYEFKGKSLISFLSIFPIIVPGSVFAMGIHVFFIKISLANTALGVLIVHLIYTMPYSVSIISDLTESIGIHMEMQSYVLGVSPLKSFTYITLPLLTPGILASVSMAYISSFSQYFITLLIGGGKVKTLNTIMVPFISKGDRSLASAYAMIFMLSTVFVFVLIDFISKKFTYSTSKGEM